MKQNFKWIDDFIDSLAKVELSDGTYNFIDRQDNLLSRQNFKDVYDFEEGFALVELSDDNWNYIDIKGNLLSKQNFEWVDAFEDGFAEVKLLDGDEYYIDKDLNFYDYRTKTPVPNPFNYTQKLNNMKQNFKRIGNFNDGLARVQLLDGNWNYIDKEDNLLSKQNFKYAYSFCKGFGKIKLSDNKWYHIDKNLNFYDTKSKTPVPNPFNETLDETVVNLAKFYDLKLELKSNLENIDLSELKRGLDKAIDKKSTKELVNWINSQKQKKSNTQTKSKLMGLDLKELERRLDEALEKETPESLRDWLNKQRTISTIKSTEWKIGTCTQGESCWCRTILLKDEVLDFEGEPIYVAPSGTIDKEIAEYLISLHNETIKRF
jgi:hypothetical protein